HGARVCGLDKDQSALESAGGRLSVFGERARLFLLPFSEFASALDELGWDEVDGMLLDIGVSSMQLDTAERGFSFIADGPLDMRMNPDPGKSSAWDLVNRERFDVLKRIIAELGEDPQAGRIARRIVEERQKNPIDSTRQLAALVERAYPPAWRAKARNHPATRTFQALRMTVNDELGELRRFLDKALSRLRNGGRLAIIAFHSLEDRMVKRAMRDWARACLCPPDLPRCVCRHVPEARVLTKKPVCASAKELAGNPRAASAKLRVVEKTAPAGDGRDA
ncbi:MAG: 16S rRNA (cytosine(1402)-N(4))-methyltransferase RsmH, partial [Desulfovibrionaceae bacterium]|nr:16S rRNA (cytosine(1402)-N(4))-methyltransferase RsmH [Desulfovibrionaceae bacterium]